MNPSTVSQFSDTALRRSICPPVIFAVLIAAILPALNAVAGVIYSQEFGTSSDSANFAATYPGFTQSGPVWNASVDGYATTDTSGSGSLWRTMDTYDWSAPLTVSAEIGSPNGSGGNSLGIFFSTSAGPGSRGISFRSYIPSNSNGAFACDSSAGNRSLFGVNNARGIDPDVSGGGVLTKISLTIRQNADGSTKFDWLATVNDTEVWTSLADGGTGTSGWHIGISKAVLNAGAGLASFGIAYDGMFPRIDNLTVTLTPSTEAEMLSFGLPGFPAVITGTDIAWDVAGSMDVTALAPVFSMSPGATCVPPSGTERDFTTPQTYTVTSQDGLTEEIYTVTVTQAPISSAKDIMSFHIAPGLPLGTIGENTISVTVPLNHDVTAMAPTYTVSPLASGSPPSGTTRDFSTPQTYTITAEDSSTKDYTVTVTKADIPIYQESFDTVASVVDFPTTYTGFTRSGPLWQAGASGYAETESSGGGYLWRAMPAYDWSTPLKVSAQIGSPNAGGGQSLGIFFGTSSGPGSSGITFRSYVPSTTNGAFVGLSDSSSRTIFGINGSRGIDPDVLGGGVLTKIALTIRENESDNTKFDWLAEVNDTVVWTSVENGGTGDSGWHLGINKSVLNAPGGLASFGFGYDGMIARVDNLTLEQIQPPAQTTVALVSSANPAITGTNVTFTATVLHNSVTATGATGTITFEVDGTAAEVVTVANGVATFYSTTLATGNRTIHAIYSGDADHQGSSNSLVQGITDSPYDIWTDSYELAGGPGGDDGDGMTNFQEFAFGLDPISAASVNPVTDTDDLAAASQFSYTRLANSGLTYTVWVSADLQDWGVAPVAVTEEAGEPDENGVVTVLVELIDPPDSDILFVRVKAE